MTHKELARICYEEHRKKENSLSHWDVISVAEKIEAVNLVDHFLEFPDKQGEGDKQKLFCSIVKVLKHVHSHDEAAIQKALSGKSEVVKEKPVAKKKEEKPKEKKTPKKK